MNRKTLNELIVSQLAQAPAQAQAPAPKPAVDPRVAILAKLRAEEAAILKTLKAVQDNIAKIQPAQTQGAV